MTICFQSYRIPFIAFVIAILPVLLSTNAQADVFRCSLPDGRTVYQERPCTVGVEKAIDDRDTRRSERAAQMRKDEEQLRLKVAQEEKIKWDRCEAEKSCDDMCFNAGGVMAVVFLANFSQATQVGLLASDMMKQGCEKQVGERGAACVRQCEIGFSVEAKQALRR